MKLVVDVRPNSKKGPLIELQPDSSLTVYLKEVPERGKANESLLKLLARHLDVPKSCLSVAKGRTSRHKIIEVDIGF